MKLFIGIVLGAVAAVSVGAIGVAVAHARTKAATRREVTGKSGRKWFVDAVGNNPPTFEVFEQLTGGSFILRYSDTNGVRKVLQQAPTVLTADAVKDFVTG